MYDFKILPEAVRAALFAAIIFVATTAASFNGSNIDDWQRWAVSTGSAGIAFVGAAVLGVLRKSVV